MIHNRLLQSTLFWLNQCFLVKSENNHEMTETSAWKVRTEHVLSGTGIWRWYWICEIREQKMKGQEDRAVWSCPFCDACEQNGKCQVHVRGKTVVYQILVYLPGEWSKVQIWAGYSELISKFFMVLLESCLVSQRKLLFNMREKSKVIYMTF